MEEQATTAPIHQEDLYAQSLRELHSPRPAPITSLLFVILLLVFVAGVFTNLRSITGVILLVVAVLVHEAGHALGMRLFGFRDVKMFFIPFFGAAVSGRPRGVAAWKDAMVSLLGPLPGLVAGVAMLIWATRQPHPTSFPFRAVEVLLVLNAFNLLPFGFLDGGRFLERVLFSRHRVLEVAFQALGTIALGIVAVVGQMWMLGLFALLSMGGLPGRWRVLSAAAALKRAQPGIDPDPDRLAEANGHAVFAAAQQTLKPPASTRAADVALAMESILGAVKRAPGVMASAGLLLLYGAGWLCALVGLVVLSMQVGPVEWKVVEHATWQAEFPRQPIDGVEGVGAMASRDSTWRTAVDGTERFAVTVREGAGEAGWVEAVVADLGRRTRTTPSGSHPVVVSGRAGVEFEFSAAGRVMRARMVSTGARRYQVTASAPAWGPHQKRFIDSFALRDPAAQP